MTEIPGYVAGKWDIDPVHSEVGFTVRHMMVSKVRGTFDKFEGSIVTGEKPEDSSVTASVEMSSINTKNEQRDGDIRGAAFLDVEAYPTMTFTSTGIRNVEGDGFLLDGDLSLKGVTRPVTFEVELNGIGPDAFGGTRIGFSAITEINRKDFNVSYDGPIPGTSSGVVVSDKVTVNLEIEGVLQQG
jgi:polyisoprenoid-binding protein YceI